VLGALYRILIAESRLARRLRHRRRFPGLAVHDLAELACEGELRYGRRASIGSGAIVLVPRGASLSLGEGAYVGRHVELAPGGRIEIGARTSIQDRSVLLGDIRVGRYCTIAYGVYASSGEHRFADALRLVKDQDMEALSAPGRVVRIDDDCWIGNGVFIAAGTRIGKGSVVGANSVVTHDVPPYTIVAGAPARALRQRLAFKPPRELAHDRREDLPYFYSGFRVAEDERAADRELGGIVAAGPFALALDTDGASRIRIRARSVAGGGQALSCAGSVRSLDAQFTDLEFPVEAMAALLEFSTSTEGAVCVQRARVE
jgi:acetyltransferase-like isoleucine patch superfamily enzyme